MVLVIWYGNLREETSFIFYRLWGEWRPVSIQVLLMVFLVTYVVPTFANLYNSMQAKLPIMTVYMIAIGEASQKYIVFIVAGLAAASSAGRTFAEGFRGSARATAHCGWMPARE